LEFIIEPGMKSLCSSRIIKRKEIILSTLQLSDSLVEEIVATIVRLAPRDQTILLNKLTETVKGHNTLPKNFPEKIFLPKPPNAPSFEELCGAWEDDRSAEEIIEDLRRSRTPNLDRVNFD